MRTIILPGFSSKNKQWAHDIRDKMDLDHEVVIIEWRHWGEAERSFSISHETQKVRALSGDEEINLIAKSVGTRVAARLIKDIPERINKVILCGIPTKGNSKEAKKNYSPLSKFNPKKVFVIQNEDDPFASSVEVKKFVKSINPGIIVTKKPGSKHHYPYPELFKKLLK